jgi:tetratricopeptide (TPR) repeat protein
MIPHTVSIQENNNSLSIVATLQSETQKMDVPIFVFLSREELQAASGKGKGFSGMHKEFLSLMQKKWPWLECNWKSIFEELEKKADVLPLRAEHALWRLENPFQTALENFARQILSIPNQLDEESRNLILRHRDSIDFVLHAVDNLLNKASAEKQKTEKKSAKESADPFLWKRILSTETISPELEEQAVELYERGAFDTAWQVFALLVGVFPDYTDGYNFLGLIRMEEERFDEARTFFELAVASGRRKLPNNLLKVDWENGRETEPYLRALRNLALVCERSGRFEQALEVCEHLRNDCQDFDSADSYTATTYLKMGRWNDARAVASRLTEVLPEFGIVAAIAAVQEHKDNEAGLFLEEAAKEAPRIVAECFGIRLPRPKTPEDREEQDYAEDFADDVAPVLEQMNSLKRNVLTGMARELILSARIKRNSTKK